MCNRIMLVIFLRPLLTICSPASPLLEEEGGVLLFAIEHPERLLLLLDKQSSEVHIPSLELESITTLADDVERNSDRCVLKIIILRLPWSSEAVHIADGSLVLADYHYQPFQIGSQELVLEIRLLAAYVLNRNLH